MIFLIRHAHAVWKDDDQRPLSLTARRPHSASAMGWA